jgi:hypothetical protein
MKWGPMIILQIIACCTWDWSINYQKSIYWSFSMTLEDRWGVFLFMIFFILCYWILTRTWSDWCLLNMLYLSWVWWTKCCLEWFWEIFFSICLFINFIVSWTWSFFSTFIHFEERFFLIVFLLFRKFLSHFSDWDLSLVILILSWPNMRSCWMLLKYWTFGFILAWTKKLISYHLPIHLHWVSFKYCLLFWIIVLSWTWSIVFLFSFFFH